MTAPSQRGTVIRLGTAQTLAWASSYYLPAMLAIPMARDLGLASSTVFVAFSAALIVSALLGPLAGRTIDRHGGRPVLVGTEVTAVQEGIPAVIPTEMCYLGWQESLQLLALLVEAEVPG